MISFERLHELLTYEPITGLFVWKINKGSAKANTIAGSYKGSYRHIAIDGQRYRASHLAHLYMTGYLPPEDYEMDHIDRDPRNDAWDNLRLATKSQNRINRGMQKNNTSGYKGVHWHRTKARYEASYGLDGKLHHIGYYDTPEAAHAARQTVIADLFGDYAAA